MNRHDRATCPYSIGRRLSWKLAALAAVGLSLLGLLVFFAVRMQVAQAQQHVMDLRVQKVLDIARKAAADGADPGERAAAYAMRRGGTRLEITDARGAVIYRDPDQPPFVLSAHVVERRFEARLGTALPEPLRFHLVVDAHDDAELLHRLGLILAVVVPVGTLAIGMAALVTVRRGLAPLRELARQTREIQPDQLGSRLVLAPPVEELQPWVDQFNAMLERLERAYLQLENFNADVAHELRTPLANLIGQTEVSLSRERAASDMRETLQSNLEELQRLSTLVHDMLFLSRADRGVSARRGATRSLATLLTEVAEFHEAALEERSLRVQVDGDAQVAVDEGLVKRAVSNLLDNATRFAEAGSTLRIAIDSPEPAAAVRITVENRGAAIAPEHLPRLFDRFFRVDSSRPDGGSHHGLGLAIVAAIARMHEGRTHAESGAGSTRIGFELAPQAPAPRARPPVQEPPDAAEASGRHGAAGAAQAA